MGFKVIASWTCDVCGCTEELPHQQHPQAPRPTMPHEWGVVWVGNECKRELCPRCMSRVRCIVGPHCDVSEA